MSCTSIIICFRLIIGLSISLGLFAFELVGFLGGISMFVAPQGLLCILHLSITLGDKQRVLVI